MIVKFLILLSAFSAVLATPTCGKNEVFRSCSSPEWPRPTCTREVHMTDKMCHQGACVCIDDHVFENGTCIPSSECGKYCKKGLEFTKCGDPSGPTCQLPCRDARGDCVNMCACKKGYLLDFDGSCQPAAECIKDWASGGTCDD